MASESPIPTSERLHDVNLIKCFGSFAAADIDGAANTFVKLPFLETKDVVIDNVAFSCDKVSNTALQAFSLAQNTTGDTPSGAIEAGERICANVLAADVATFGAPTSATITPGTHNNIVPAGSGLYLYVLADDTSSALSGLVIHVRYRTRRK